MVNVRLPYRDRRQAGRVLASLLQPCVERHEAIVLGLARGGVPVAYEVAIGLNIPLDVFVVRKLGVPGREELAMGAIASGGVRVLNPQVLAALKIKEAILQEVTERESRELDRRQEKFRGTNPVRSVKNKAIILVDDGLATGATMRAAIRALRSRDIRSCIVAVPVGAPDSCAELQAEVDELFCAATPQSFRGVGQFYENFTQTTDEEVRDLLTRAAGIGSG
jgi:putative phosphoribosyl transferase